MTLYSLIYLLITILVVVLFCVLILYVVEEFWGPIDGRIKRIAGLIVLLLLLLYILRHTGVLSGF